MKSIYSHDRTAFTKLITSQFGELKSVLRAEQIFKDIYKETQLPKTKFFRLNEDVKLWLKGKFLYEYPLEINHLQSSTHDGSVKFAMRLKKMENLLKAC